VIVSAPRRVDVGTAHAFRLQLLEALDRAVQVVVDLSRVEVLDVAGAAVLIGASRRATQAGRIVSMQAPSATVVRALTDSGLARCLRPADGAAIGASRR
jgi:anti-anti-sigma factor